MTKLKPQKRKRLSLAEVGLGACVGSALIAGVPAVCAQQTAGTNDTARVEKLEKENDDLRKRLEALENVAQKEGLAPSSGAKPLVKALADMQISGFVTASYFYDTSTPRDNISPGYLWNTHENSFSINKVKVTLASPPAERSGDKWTAGYRVSLIWGEDASVVNTGGEVQGLENVREAYVDLNAPLGSGVSIKAGQLISLLNYESGDGGAANANFSQGYQWFYTGNGPSTGVRLGYTFTDWMDVKVQVQNGMYAGAIDNNSSKAVIGSIGFKPMKDFWFNLIGFWSHENDAFTVDGGSLLAGYKATKALDFGLEVDYFHFSPDPAPDAALWSVGGWITYQFTPKYAVAFRGDYLNDKDGFGIKGIQLGNHGPLSAIYSPDATGNLGSLTLTFNYSPIPAVKIQPEVRYDYTSYKNGFSGVESRFIVGAGVSYLF